MKSTSCFVIAALCGSLLFSISAPATAANIAWVTFHSADGTPSTNAGTAGFTQAPDVGYTNALTAAGHNVTRVVTQDAPLTPAKIATLNSSDLIIIGRSVASGHYQQAAETLFWNTTVTKPIINTNAYTMRQNRLGLYTGNNIPDTGPTAAMGGPVRLTVTNPSHPIFNGVAVDGTNTMVNLYADVVTTPFAPNTPQRGISVVYDGIVPGGQVLATAPVTNFGAMPAPTMHTGTFIALFPPGTVAANAAPANVLTAHRLMFLTGSREHDGLTSEGSGIYDLQPDGARMFLNAVGFMLVIPEPSTASLLLLAVAGFGLLRKR